MNVFVLPSWYPSGVNAASGLFVHALGMRCTQVAPKLSDGILFERRLFHSLFATSDQKEGMDAFLNKRSPNFRNA